VKVLRLRARVPLLRRSVSQVGAVAWLPMVICFSVIVGLGKINHLAPI
jgi:hypothetical protein